MHPVIGELIRVISAAALCALIFVMREFQIYAAAMNINRVAIIPAAQSRLRHRATFDVPARTTSTKGRVPSDPV